MSQKNRILEHLMGGQAITPLEALDRYGCFRLAAVVRCLRLEGHRIATKMVSNGSGKHYAEYRFKPAEELFELLKEGGT